MRGERGEREGEREIQKKGRKKKRGEKRKERKKKNYLLRDSMSAPEVYVAPLEVNQNLWYVFELPQAMNFISQITRSGKL